MAMNEKTLDDIGHVDEQVIRGIFEAVRFVWLDSFDSFLDKLRSDLLNLINRLVTYFRVYNLRYLY